MSIVLAAIEVAARCHWPSSGDVAIRLAISAQHVRRLLRDEGTSLAAIKEELLRDGAIAGLVRGETAARR